ncbi:MAG: TonB-dependent siderophore receptor [Paracoccaceae bacterium]
MAGTASIRGFLLTTTIWAGLAGLAMAQETTGDVTVLDPITLKAQRAQGYDAKSSTAGTKTSTPLAETPATISVVTAQQMEDQAVTSVAQALRYTPGVSAEYRGASNISDEIYVRGFGYVPRYVDGLVFSGSGQQIDPWILDDVAVIKGPASLLYGQSSPGGMVDSTTKKADGSTINRLGFTTGSQARLGGRFDFAAPIAGTDLSWRVVGLAEKADTQEKGLQTRRLTLAPSLQWKPTDATTLTVYGMYQREPDAGYRNFREYLGTVEPTSYGYIPADFLVGDPDFERSERTAHSLGYSIEHRFDDTTTFRQKARVSSGDWYQRTLVWGSLAADERTISRTVTESWSETDQATIDNQVEKRLSFGGAEHVILAGVDIQYTKSDSRSTYGASAPSIDWTNPVYGTAFTPGTPRGTSDSTSRVRQTGVYLQDQATWGNLHVQAGLRYDWAKNDTTDHIAGTRVKYDSEALTGRIGALYEMPNGFSPYISYSTSFEPVTQTPGAGQDPFDPTEGKQLEVGVKWVNPDDTLMVTASVYDLRQTNVLKYDSATALYEQIGEIRSRGFELEGRGQITQAFSLIGSYSYNDSRITKSTIPTEIGYHNDRVPRHQASLWGKYEFESGWDVGLGVRYIGKSWARSNAFTVPGATLVDASIGYDFGKMDGRYDGLHGQLNVSNLFDKFYTASCASRYACFIGNERTITASLDYEW